MTQKKQPNLTPEQQAIKARVDAQEKLKADPVIREDELNDFSLMKNQLALPDKAKELQDKKIYAFRWCTRTPDRIDYLTRSMRPPERWGIVTRTTIPEMEKEVDPMLGCVCRLDQALLYKPWQDHARVQRAKMELADAGLNTGTLEGKKHQMQSKTDGVEVMAGEKHRIGGGDEIMGEDLLSAADSELGDLVEA